jgi:hypothetical protein
VHVIEVDDVGLQLLQALVVALTNIGGVAAGDELSRRALGRIARDAELRCQRDLIATTGRSWEISRSLSPLP